MPPKTKPKAKPKAKTKPKAKAKTSTKNINIKDKSVKQIVTVNVNSNEKKTRAKSKPKPKPEVDFYDMLQYRSTAPQLQISGNQSATPDIQTIKQMIENHKPSQLQNDINRIAGTSVRDAWAGRFDQHKYPSDGTESIASSYEPSDRGVVEIQQNPQLNEFIETEQMGANDINVQPKTVSIKSTASPKIKNPFLRPSSRYSTSSTISSKSLFDESTVLGGFTLPTKQTNTTTNIFKSQNNERINPSGSNYDIKPSSTKSSKSSKSNKSNNETQPAAVSDSEARDVITDLPKTPRRRKTEEERRAYKAERNRIDNEKAKQARREKSQIKLEAKRLKILEAQKKAEDK